MTALIKHDQHCRSRSGHTDDAKRISDAYRLHRMAGAGLGIDNVGRWLAFALADGKGDGVLYDSRGDAVRHMGHNELYFCYVQIVPKDMTVCDAELYLAVQRRMYHKNIRLMDRDAPSGGMVQIPRLSREDNVSLMRSILHGGPASNMDYRHHER